MDDSPEWVQNHHPIYMICHSDMKTHHNHQFENEVGGLSQSELKISMHNQQHKSWHSIMGNIYKMFLQVMALISLIVSVFESLNSETYVFSLARIQLKHSIVLPWPSLTAIGKTILAHKY